MLPALVLKTWRDDRRPTIGWAAAAAVFTGVYAGLYSQFRDVAELKQQALPEGMLEFLGVADLLSPQGYLQSSVFALVGPILVLGCAVTTAARTIAQPEEGGGLELLLAVPLSRTRFAGQRLLAHLAEITVVALMPWLVLLVVVPLIGMDVPLGHVSAACAGLVLLAWCFAGITFLVGAATGRRGTALAAGGGLALASYVVNGLAEVFDWFDVARYLSPFHYVIGTDPLHTGWHPAELATLLAVAALATAAGLTGFDRRDVGV